MPPRGIEIGELVIASLTPTLAHEPLAVGIGGHVGGVDSHVRTHLRKGLVKRSGHPVEAGVEQRLEGAELRPEAIAGVDARDAALASEGSLKRRVLGDEGHGAGPGRDGVDRLGEGHTDHGSKRVAGAAGPAGLLKLGYEPPDLGRVEESCKLGRR